MTEEQKIAEGKRMFSIFAARMFEQRVLSAYREKVAQERQRQLLQELAEEESAKSQREAKSGQKWRTAGKVPQELGNFDLIKSVNLARAIT